MIERKPETWEDARMRRLWLAVRLQVWAIFCALDDHYEIPRIGSKRPKE